ncbi:thioredoxin family protein [Actinomadura sp. 9N407]|uniref:thioredoxin family protein n=1 Tax=Actinomadura sp. 9N407 TaxID=3375154 RepID=UPI00378A8C58
MPAVTWLLVLATALLATTACGIVEAGGRSERPVAVPPAAMESPVSPHPAALRPAYDPKGDAAAEIGAALAKAQTDRRPVLLDFGARWCPECATLQQAFRLKAVRPILDGYHLVTIDVGRIDRRLGLARKYGLDLKRTGIPALVVLSATGEVRTAGNEGLYPASSHGELLPGNIAAFLRRWQ